MAARCHASSISGRLCRASLVSRPVAVTSYPPAVTSTRTVGQVTVQSCGHRHHRRNHHCRRCERHGMSVTRFSPPRCNYQRHHDCSPQGKHRRPQPRRCPGDELGHVLMHTRRRRYLVRRHTVWSRMRRHNEQHEQSHCHEVQRAPQIVRGFGTFVGNPDRHPDEGNSSHPTSPHVRISRNQHPRHSDGHRYVAESDPRATTHRPGKGEQSSTHASKDDAVRQDSTMGIVHIVLSRTNLGCLPPAFPKPAAPRVSRPSRLRRPHR